MKHSNRSNRSNRLHRSLATSALSVLLALIFTACSSGGGETTTAGLTVKTTGAPEVTTSPTTDPTNPIDPIDPTDPIDPPLPTFEDLYPTVGGKSNLFDMTANTGVIDGASAATAATDGKLLIFSTATYGTEEDSFATKRMVYALDIETGKIVSSIDFDYDLCEIFFLEDGNIMISAEPAHVRIVDRELKTLGAYDVSAFTDVMSVDGRGYVWESSSGKYMLVKRDIITDKTDYFSMDGYEYAYYLASNGDMSYFRTLDIDYDAHIIALNEKNGDITELSALNEMYGDQCTNGILGRDLSGNWVTTSLSLPSVALRFSAECESEYFTCAYGDRFVTDGCKIDEFESNTIVVYNVKNGDRLCVLQASAIGCDSLNGISIDKDGNMLLIAWNNVGEEGFGDYRASIYLWRTASEPLYRACEDALTIDLNGGDLPSESAGTIEAVKNTYGVEIKYAEADLIGAFFDYELYPMTDSITLTEGIDIISSVIAEFPRGFYDEVCEGGGFDKLVIYLCSGFRPLDTNGIETAVALTGTNGNTIIMAFDLTSLIDIRQNFAHEMMHAMEHRIAEYLNSMGESIYDRWDSLNPSGFEYYYSYHDSDGNEVSDTTDTTWDGSLDAHFVDPYSKSFPSEDRARVFEYIFVNGRDYFEGPNLQSKAEVLISIINEAFPSIAGASGGMPWEQ